MRLLPLSALPLALFACTALAQSNDLQSRMGSERFNASGLQKLSPEELMALTQWIDAQSPSAASLEEAREAGRRESVWTPPAAQPPPEPVSSTLVGRFEGFARGREYTLANGQVWRQTGDTPLRGVRAEAPAVEITPARLGGWMLRVEGYNTRTRVERVR